MADDNRHDGEFNDYETGSANVDISTATTNAVLNTVPKQFIKSFSQIEEIKNPDGHIEKYYYLSVTLDLNNDFLKALANNSINKYSDGGLGRWIYLNGQAATEISTLFNDTIFTRKSLNTTGQSGSRDLVLEAISDNTEVTQSSGAQLQWRGLYNQIQGIFEREYGKDKFPVSEAAFQLVFANTVFTNPRDISDFIYNLRHGEISLPLQVVRTETKEHTNKLLEAKKILRRRYGLPAASYYQDFNQYNHILNIRPFRKFITDDATLFEETGVALNFKIKSLYTREEKTVTDISLRHSRWSEALLYFARTQALGITGQNIGMYTTGPVAPRNPNAMKGKALTYGTNIEIDGSIDTKFPEQQILDIISSTPDFPYENLQVFFALFAEDTVNLIDFANRLKDSRKNKFDHYKITAFNNGLDAYKTFVEKFFNQISQSIQTSDLDVPTTDDVITRRTTGERQRKEFNIQLNELLEYIESTKISTEL